MYTKLKDIMTLLDDESRGWILTQHGTKLLEFSFGYTSSANTKGDFDKEVTQVLVFSQAEESHITQCRGKTSVARASASPVGPSSLCIGFHPQHEGERR
jgi:hypothetical protein